MRNQWPFYLRKWPKIGIFFTFLRPKVAPKSGLSGPYSTHHWKYLQWASKAILMWNQWKVPRNVILTYLGPKMVPRLGSWGSYSTHRWKYLQWGYEAILMWHQWKTFEKMTKVQNFYSLWGPKWAKNWVIEAHILHISESSSIEHIKQDWCESRGNFSTK